MTIQLYIFRHGPTSASPASFIGSTDAGLSGHGLERLTGVIPYLTDIDCWYASPMRRTRQTVEELRERGCSIQDIVYDNRLREIDFGRWEQKTFSEIAAADPVLVLSWKDYENFTFPQGEAVHDFIRRVQEMLNLFTELNKDRIGIMTHGGVIRTMICLALGIPARDYLLFDVQPASLTLLELYDQGGVLKGLNL
jgi:broad specificity phosphatase PhoE